jgi:hypothetical protein
MGFTILTNRGKLLWVKPIEADNRKYVAYIEQLPEGDKRFRFSIDKQNALKSIISDKFETYDEAKFVCDQEIDGLNQWGKIVNW